MLSWGNIWASRGGDFDFFGQEFFLSKSPTPDIKSDFNIATEDDLYSADSTYSDIPFHGTPLITTLSPVQTSYFSCTEYNANEVEQYNLLVSIVFDA